MGLISVDKNKCKQDGLCILDCPFGILEKDESGFPVPKDEAAENCINCGHCVAICPHDALTLESHLSKECESIKDDIKISENSIAQLIKRRRSIRHYKDEPVSQDKIEKLLDMVRWAPTAVNCHSVHWIVTKSREKTFKIAELVAEWARKSDAWKGLVEAWDNGYDCILRGAPNLLIAHAPKEVFSPAVDCNIATTTFELAASAVGLGTCWAGIFMTAAHDYVPLIEYLGIPEDHHVFSALMLGYPKYKYSKIPNRDKAKVEWM